MPTISVCAFPQRQLWNGSVDQGKALTNTGVETETETETNRQRETKAETVSRTDTDRSAPAVCKGSVPVVFHSFSTVTSCTHSLGRSVAVRGVLLTPASWTDRRSPPPRNINEGEAPISGRRFNLGRHQPHFVLHPGIVRHALIEIVSAVLYPFVQAYRLRASRIPTKTQRKTQTKAGSEHRALIRHRTDGLAKKRRFNHFLN